MSFELIPFARGIHLLGVTVWVGGMFFAYMALRPAAAALEPPLRLPLWSRTFGRFFPWVWLAIGLLLASGYWIIFTVGGFKNVGAAIHVMHATGIVMVLIFLHVFFAPYRRMRQALLRADYAEAGQRLGQIRRLIGINLSLGLLTVLIATWGRYFMS